MADEIGASGSGPRDSGVRTHSGALTHSGARGTYDDFGRDPFLDGPPRQCGGCGGEILPEQRICAQCGKVQRKTRRVHCRQCGTRNPGGSAVCRACGGPLRAGRVRSVLAMMAILVIVGLVLVGGWWLFSNWDGLQLPLGQPTLVSGIGPASTLSPVVASSSPLPAPSQLPTLTKVPTALPSFTPTSTHSPTPRPTATETHTPTSTPSRTPLPTSTRTRTPTATPSYTPTLPPTLTPTATKTSEPTASPTSTTSATPTSTTTSTPAPTLTSTSAVPGTATPFIYVVKSGDNLYNIALQYNTTVDAIMVANGLESNRLRVGQQLIIPVGTTTPQPAPTQTPTATPAQP
jgi:LysM repeat protein/predicted nucleic acid-binding Zn ribbon protein